MFVHRSWFRDKSTEAEVCDLLFISCARQSATCLTCLTCLGPSEAPAGTCPISYPSMPCHWQLRVSSGIPWDLLLTGLLLLLGCCVGAHHRHCSESWGTFGHHLIFISLRDVSDYRAVLSDQFKPHVLIRDKDIWSRWPTTTNVLPYTWLLIASWDLASLKHIYMWRYNIWKNIFDMNNFSGQITCLSVRTNSKVFILYTNTF